ncbi:unnamed protein product [Psylliodes chrysocephalus]|uniref:Nucleoside diphosphate kinase n=2 Tax=Psylliodes chrysocephalus TaxID=3402493 RepID=A0A9P0CVI2_9CUCU|nr:unnamed protein product [Psylliodes chrysocephala]
MARRTSFCSKCTCNRLLFLSILLLSFDGLTVEYVESVNDFSDVCIDPHVPCESMMSSAMAANSERTFIMVKPDGVQRGLVGKIIKRFEQKGFKLVALKFLWPSEELLQKHYADLAGKPFFPGLIKYMSSGPVVPMVWEGLGVVKTGRVLLGATNPADSAPGTIRGDLCIQVGRNICHGSDAVESANKEINLWFNEKEVVSWTSADAKWVYED